MCVYVSDFLWLECLMQWDKTVFPVIILDAFVWQWVYEYRHMHLTTCTYICVYIHISLCIYKYLLYKSLWEVKMLSYLRFHMLQSQCENNHLIKKKEKSRENKSNEAIPGLSPSFHSWHSQSLLPSSCSSLHDQGELEGNTWETQHFSNFSSPSGLGNMGKDVVSIRICCSWC